MEPVANVDPPPAVASSTTLGELSPPDETTTTARGAVSLEGRGFVWEPGVIYESEKFVVPITFHPRDPGWRSFGAETRWVALGVAPAGESTVAAFLTFMVHMPDANPVEALDSIVAMEGLEEVSPRVDAEVSGHPAVVVDIEAAPLGLAPGTGDSSPCSRPEGDPRFRPTDPGYELFYDREAGNAPGLSFGLPSCYTSRVWAIDVNGSLVLAVAVARDTERRDELLMTVDEFLESSVALGERG